MITKWFDRQGRPITIVEANDLLGDPTYVIIARDIWDNVIVSTVWLGCDHAHGGDKYGPQIFETRVFGGPLDTLVLHYRTEAEAIVGHNRAAAETLTQLEREKTINP